MLDEHHFFPCSLYELLRILNVANSAILSVETAEWFCDVQVIVVPLIDGMLGSKIPAYTWFGATASIVGVAMLESSGSSPCVSVY